MGALDGKVTVVTGGASGIGLATVRRFAAEGAEVVVADLDAAAGETAADEVGGSFVRLDVASPSAWRALVDDLRSARGRLDVVHLNAGVLTGEGEIGRITDEQYRRIMAVNVDGVVFGARAVAPVMAADGGGAIVVTASLAGLIGFAPDPIYTLTKHAVVGLVRSLGTQLAPAGITVNAICPGIVDTPLVSDDARTMLQQAGFPMIPPDDIADAVLHAVTCGQTGAAWVCQPGRPPEPFRFPDPPGPRTEGTEGVRPPAGLSGS